MKIATYLLYSDDRVNLKKEAYLMADKFFNEMKLEKNEEDIKYFEDIKVSNVRDIISTSSESSYSGIKVFILNLDNIAVVAVNALLKIIEEAPKNTVFILISKTLKLPSTILSRAIKIHIKSKKYDVSNEVYEMFDGNSNYIESYLEKNINIEEYILENISEIKQSFEDYIKDNKNIYYKIKYEMALDYLIIKSKYSDVIEKISLIQDILDVYGQDRKIAFEFLERILIKAKNEISIDKYIYLVELKNNIKLNVSIKSTLYIFFNIMLGVENV